MARLPSVGGDSEQWGAILNEFLEVSHTSEGSLKFETWANAAARPASPESGQSGINLETKQIEQWDGSTWISFSVLPDQSSNNGKYLTTDGTTASWATVASGTIPARTGGVVAFDVPAVYNAPSSPSNFSGFDLTAAVNNTEVVGYFNNSSQPSFGAGTYVVGTWNPGQLNIVRFVYVGSNNISVSIFSAQGQTTNIDTRYVFAKLTADVQTTGTSGVTLADITKPLAANSVYRVKILLHTGCNNTGGLKIAATFPSGASFDAKRIGTTTAVTAVSAAYAAFVSGVLSSIQYNAFNGTNGFVEIEGLLVTSSTAGDLSIQFASSTSTQTSSIFSSGSFIELFKES